MSIISYRVLLKYSKIVRFKGGNVSFNAGTNSASNPSNGSTKGGNLNPRDVSITSRGSKSISIIDEVNPKFIGEETSKVNNSPGGALNHTCTYKSDDAIMDTGTTIPTVAPAFVGVNGGTAFKTINKPFSKGGASAFPWVEKFET